MYGEVDKIGVDLMISSPDDPQTKLAGTVDIEQFFKSQAMI